MPANFLHSVLHPVEKGWDPIPAEYATEYDQHAARESRPALVDILEEQIGGFSGKRVLDFGGGPGQYSILFAQRGANVTWHDVSRQYQAIAMTRAQNAGVKITYSLGYLEAAKRFQADPFDLVFCRVCWYYARSDRNFARLLYSLIKPGGMGYIECNTPAFSKPTGLRKLQYWLNDYLWWKIGHPMPPRGRIEGLIQKYPVRTLNTDYSSEFLDVVSFRKSN
jgi:SAM-dependent methyltransferase